MLRMWLLNLVVASCDGLFGNLRRTWIGTHDAGINMANRRLCLLSLNLLFTPLSSFLTTHQIFIRALVFLMSVKLVYIIYFFRSVLPVMFSTFSQQNSRYQIISSFNLNE